MPSVHLCPHALHFHGHSSHDADATDLNFVLGDKLHRNHDSHNSGRSRDSNNHDHDRHTHPYGSYDEENNHSSLPNAGYGLFCAHPGPYGSGDHYSDFGASHSVSRALSAPD